MDSVYVRDFVIENPEHTQEVFDAVHTVIQISQGEDYFTVNDRVFMAVVGQGVFKYTHELRKFYQMQIKFLMGIPN